MSALNFPEGFEVVGRHDCPHCTEAVRIVGTCAPMSAYDLNNLAQRTESYVITETPGGLIYVSRRHAVRHGYVASSNCELILPSIRDAAGVEAGEFRGVADSIYAALYAACLDAKPQDRIVDFDQDALLALPIWQWATDAFDHFGPLALLPGDRTALAATLLTDKLSPPTDMGRFERTQVTGLPGAFLARISASVK